MALGDNTSSDGREGLRAQSEVIGVTLLVAIAIVLAAVAGQVIFGLDLPGGDDEVVAPQTSFGTTEVVDEDGEGDLIIEHLGGDGLNTSDLLLVPGGDGELDGDSIDDAVGEIWTASETVTVKNLEEGDTVRLIWLSPNTDDSAVIFEYEFEARDESG